MTVSSENRKAGPYTGNDTTTAFPFYFYVFSAADLVITKADASGNETTLTLNSDYIVSLNSDQSSNPGGTVTLSSALASTYTLTITSDVANLQSIDFTNLGGLFPKLFNTGFDKLTVLIQQLAEKVSRTLKLAVSTPDGVSSDLPKPVGGQVLGWNTAGTQIVNLNPVGNADMNLRSDLAGTTGAKLVQDGMCSVSDKLNSTDVDLVARNLNLNYGSVGTNWGRVVITGDSLAYNYQDFDATVRASAEECYPGMNSWPFLVRDAIIRNDKFFIHGDEVPYQMTEGVSLRGAEALRFVLPFNGRVQTFRATNQTDTIDVFYRHFGPENRCYLWLLRNPNNTACSFDVLVDSVSTITNWDNKDTTGKYQGLELYALEIPNVTPGVEHKITLTNFIGTAAVPHATARDIVVCGVSCTYNAVSLTGVGSQSSRYLLDNLSGMVTSKSPDLAIIIIGANDPWSGNPQGLQSVTQYGSNLTNIINGIRSAKAGSRILLLSPPYTSEAVIANSVMQQYIDKAEETALSNKVSFLNLAKFFAPIPTSVYRFDSIHMTKTGNELLCREILRKIGLSNMLSFSSPFFSNYNQIQLSQPVIKGGRYLLNWSGSSFVVTSLGGNAGLVTSAIKQSDSKIRVYFKYSQKIHAGLTISAFQDSSSTFPMNCTQDDLYNGFVEVSLRKEGGGIPVASDWTTYPTQFKFLVSIA